MKILNKKIKGLIEILPETNIDNRGFLVRVYDESFFMENNLNTKWIQESHSHTDKKHTIRGLHIQLPPFSETKMIKAVKGKMLWIAVDLRKDSETFGKWDSAVISDEIKNVLYVPAGFANGCISLSDECDLIIKSDNVFSPDYGVGILWNDKELGIDWNTNNDMNNSVIISERDRNYPSFSDFKKKYGGIKI